MAVKLAKLSRSKRTPKSGDIYRLRLEDGRWFLGRVVLTGMPDSPGSESNDHILLYLFRTEYDGTASVPERLPVAELLCAPVLVGEEMLEGGLFEHIESRDFKHGERLDRHCFAYLSGATYYDEYGQELSGPFEPVGAFSSTLDAGIEARIASALGEPVWYQHLLDRMEKGESGLLQRPSGVMGPVPEDSVVLFIPASDDGEPRGLDEIEDPLIEAVEGNGVGEWEGHGYDADLKEWDIRFIGRRPGKVRDALLPALRKLNLPRGSYLIVGGKRAQRIDL
ncbi:MAG: hypothetical protein IT431_18340 [Phycisphaerales bacterium]|nr:hypothetical protein [Phycisphaerales bacterium]